MKNEAKILYLIAAAALLITATASLQLLKKPSENKLSIEWRMGEAPAQASAEAPLATEITAYQAAPQLPPWRSQAFGEYDASTGVALVKQVRQAVLPAGLVTLSLKNEAAHVNPSTITVKDLTEPSTQLLEQNYEFDAATQARLLQKYLGEQVTVVTENETITGTLLNAENPITIQTSYGVASINSYSRIIFPVLPTGLRSTPTLELLLDVKNAGKHDLEVSYLTSGINWEADYIVILSADDSKADVKAAVNVRNNAGTTYKNAKLKLVAGTINLATNNNYHPYAKAATTEAATTPSPQFSQQTLAEYHLYSLQRPVTLYNGEEKQVSLFTADAVKVKKQLVFEPDVSSTVRYEIEFENKKENNLGTPMPAGKVRVFKPDSTGQMQFLGEDSIQHTPEGQKIRLTAGNSFDVTSTRTQTQQERLGDCAEQDSYKVTVKNAKTSDETVTVVHNAWGDAKVVEENLPHETESATKFAWRVPVKAGSEATLSYKILQRWC
ncbi:MAG: DUF4139 domain-containing protein [Candidatus Norongarragalinales archaeon]